MVVYIDPKLYYVVYDSGQCYRVGVIVSEIGHVAEVVRNCLFRLKVRNFLNLDLRDRL